MKNKYIIDYKISELKIINKGLSECYCNELSLLLDEYSCNTNKIINITQLYLDSIRNRILEFCKLYDDNSGIDNDSLDELRKLEGDN